MVNQRLLADASGWAGNVFTSVAIVFVNKVVMSSFGGYGFHFCAQGNGSVPPMPRARAIFLACRNLARAVAQLPH